MKNKLKIFVLITLLFIALFLANYDYTIVTSYGFYNSFFNKIYCKEYYSCLHEVGHQVDDENGMISQTFEWKYAVDWYRVQIYYYPETRDALSNEIMFFPGLGWSSKKTHNPIINSFWTGGWGGYSELYAYILEQSNGKKDRVPESLRNFYDWERIAELKEFYRSKYGR